MKVAVIGAGAIGGVIAGYLKLQGVDVSLIGRSASVRAIKDFGLSIRGVRGEFNIDLSVSERLPSQPELAILATKTQDLEVAVKENQSFLQGALVLTTQNGVSADEIVSRYLGKNRIISSIVMFGATSLEPGKVVHNFENSWILGSMFPESKERVPEVLGLAQKIFPSVAVDDIRGMKYLKIFVNANNCIPAILGLSMQESFCDLKVSELSIGIWQEGLEVVSRCGIALISLPDFPLERITKLTMMPRGEAAKIFSGIMLSLSKEPLYGSILQSLKKNRPSEVEYINGEFIRLASGAGMKAPLNEKLVELVHQVEKTKRFLSAEELLKATKGLLP